MEASRIAVVVMQKKIRTSIIVEDNGISLSFLRLILEEVFEDIVIHVATSLEEAFRVVDVIEPDLALIDLNLPDGSGVALLHHLSSINPDCVSVVTTSHADDDYLFPALGAGADGYLLKNQSRERLIKSIRGISRGEVALTPAIAHKVLEYFSQKGSDDIQSIEIQNILSKREIQVLTMIGKGYSAKKVAKEMNISYHTVTSHIKKIYDKLGISSRAEASKLALKFGLTN